MVFMLSFLLGYCNVFFRCSALHGEVSCFVVRILFDLRVVVVRSDSTPHEVLMVVFGISRPRASWVKCTSDLELMSHSRDTVLFCYSAQFLTLAFF